MRRPRRVWAGAGLTALTGVTVAVALAVGSPPTSYTSGYDVSWPQCSGVDTGHMPANRPSYLILGLTHGAGHTVNPCLAGQLSWARDRGVKVGAYLVPSYPTRRQRAAARTGVYGHCSTRVCRLRNDGASQALDAVATMRAVGLAAPMVWIDVEFRHVHPWTSHRAANAAVLQGVVRGLCASRLPMGVYSTAYMWQHITGGYRLNVPNWLPSGDGVPAHARAKCSTTATGGRTWLVQYTHGLDRDLTCPVLDPVPGRHGRLWRWRHTTQQLTSSGRAVRAVQHRVGTTPNGEYGPVTAAAVGRWQRSKHLQVTGKVQPVDWRRMGAYRSRGGHGFWLRRIVAPA